MSISNMQKSTVQTKTTNVHVRTTEIQQLFIFATLGSELALLFTVSQFYFIHLYPQTTKY